jgi:hypothetical protein
LLVFEAPVRSHVFLLVALARNLITFVNFCVVLQKINDNDVRKIVLSYLVHNCFKETAETFIQCTGMQLTPDYSVDIDKRKGVCLRLNQIFHLRASTLKTHNRFMRLSQISGFKNH